MAIISDCDFVKHTYGYIKSHQSQKRSAGYCCREISRIYAEFARARRRRSNWSPWSGASVLDQLQWLAEFEVKKTISPIPIPQLQKNTDAKRKFEFDPIWQQIILSEW